MHTLFPVTVESPNGGSVLERENLATRFSDRITVNEMFLSESSFLSRKSPITGPAMDEIQGRVFS